MLNCLYCHLYGSLFGSLIFKKKRFIIHTFVIQFQVYTSQFRPLFLQFWWKKSHHITGDDAFSRPNLRFHAHLTSFSLLHRWWRPITCTTWTASMLKASWRRQRSRRRNRWAAASDTRTGRPRARPTLSQTSRSRRNMCAAVPLKRSRRWRRRWAERSEGSNEKGWGEKRVNGRKNQFLGQFKQRMWRKGERGQEKNEQMERDFSEMGKVIEWELRERGWKMQSTGSNVLVRDTEDAVTARWCWGS